MMNINDIRYSVRDWLMAELDVNVPLMSPMKPPLLMRATPNLQDAIVAAAVCAWQEHTEEPPGEGWQNIDRFIRGVYGLGWSTADAVNWTPNAAYTRNQMFQWCGAFATWCCGTAGLKPELRCKKMASTVRMLTAFGNTERHIDVRSVRPGDIVVVTRGKKTAGEHITVAVDVNDDLVTTVEGNAQGIGPDGRVYEGVVKRTRPFVPSKKKCPISGLAQSYWIAHVYRFNESDFESE